MGYAIMRIDKIKTDHELNSRYNHNYRIYDVKNADKSRQAENEEVVSLNGLSFHDIFQDTYHELLANGAMQRKIRNDAVKAFEVVLTSSYTPDLDVSAWVEANKRWLDETFNPPGHQIHYTDLSGNEHTQTVNNIKSIVLHKDERTPHLHALIIPIDDRGHLNAKAYLGGRSKLIHLQNDYAKHMEPFGLKRGEPHSVAKPEQMSRYYNNILHAVEEELPEIIPGETVEEYRTRANDTYQVALARMNDDKVKMNQKIIQAKSRKKEENMILKQMADDLGIERITASSAQAIRTAYQNQKLEEKALDQYPDRALAEETQRNLERMIRFLREKEKEEKKKEKEYEAYFSSR